MFVLLGIMEKYKNMTQFPTTSAILPTDGVR